MDIVSPVGFAEVKKVFTRDHPADRSHENNTNQDGEKVLDMADAMFRSWFRVRLSRTDVLGVTLPWHLSEGGGHELVPRVGLTVGQAAERVRSGGAQLARANPTCTRKLDLMRGSPFTPVYLSVRPVPHSDYSDLLARDGLFHLDGLHRMIAWELGERLPERDGLDAFVAGDPTAGPR